MDNKKAQERAYQDFIDDLKDKCQGCGKWRILNESGLCDDCEKGLLDTFV